MMPPTKKLSDHYTRPDWVRRINAMGDSVGGAQALIQLDPEALAERLQTGPLVEVREVDTDGSSLHVAARPAPTYAGDVSRLAEDLRGSDAHTVILLGNTGRADRLTDVERALRRGERPRRRGPRTLGDPPH